MRNLNSQLKILSAILKELTRESMESILSEGFFRKHGALAAGCRFPSEDEIHPGLKHNVQKPS